MIGFQFKLQMQQKAVTQAADKGAYKSFRHAAASVRKTGQTKILRRPKGDVSVTQKATKRDKQGRFLKGSGKKKRRRQGVASPVGSPPYTRSGQLKRAIVFDANKEGAVIGPRRSVVGIAGALHEHGEKFKGQEFPQRPTMGPALSENLARFAGGFAGSIG